MKQIVFSIVLAIVLSGMAQAQFKDQAASSAVGQSLIRSDDSGLLFGWFDMSRLTMHQSYSLSYSTFGSKGYSLGVYTNSLMYQLSDPLSLQMDVNLVHSPYNNISSSFSKDVSGLYLSRAALTYRPSENMSLQILYRNVSAADLANPFGFDAWEGLH